MPKNRNIVLPLPVDLFEALRDKMVEIGRVDAIRETGIVDMNGIKVYCEDGEAEKQPSLELNPPPAVVKKEDGDDI